MSYPGRTLNRAWPFLPGILFLCLCAAPLMADENSSQAQPANNGAMAEQNEPAAEAPANGVENPHPTAPPDPGNIPDNQPGETPEEDMEENENPAPDSGGGVNLGDLLPQSQAPPGGRELSITDNPRPLPEGEAAPRPQTPAPESSRPLPESRTTPPTPETGGEKPPENPAPRPGDKMVLPEDAAQNHDLSFLRGCWVNASAVYEQGQMKIRTEREYCFDGKGGGIRTIREKDSPYRICRGSFSSRFDSQGVLYITSDKAVCPSGSGYYLPDELRCTGSGATTRCIGYGRDPQSGRAWEWQADFRRK